jgi:hypothetical protein
MKNARQLHAAYTSIEVGMCSFKERKYLVQWSNHMTFLVTTRDFSNQ